MIIEGTDIEIHDSLIVDGNLYLRGTNITSLPDGLKVSGSLILENTNVVSLPDGLTVGGSLNLIGTKVVSLPDGLTVGGSLIAHNRQLIASEKVQLEWIAKGLGIIRIFKEPTETAKRLHEMLWEL